MQESMANQLALHRYLEGAEHKPELWQKVLFLRSLGYTLEEIGERTDRSPAQIHRIINQIQVDIMDYV